MKMKPVSFLRLPVGRMAWYARSAGNFGARAAIIGDLVKTFLLLVTWLMHDQPPSNYQVAFSSLEACEAARLKVVNDAQRVRQDKIDQALRSGLDQHMAARLGVVSPSVSAVCVAQ
jgi:hypothetical protein